ncbi:DUF4184 family protein [Flavobacterium sp. LC2016-23]|uniref:DUF4184 family protein n=1 Tax=Flavobacterium sp. LC2016-23 TaxID=2666330 RepID=UPI0012B10109|nr:DUF4184 family protein [Flavobacterium sp. LC2016-23]MRX38441.1 DUF4184 family protein [Flavobacterium sp. LC2016-23]
MPFTFSHPALILPLKYLPRKWFSLTGLIIGSLTPDFEYFLRMKVQSNYSHTFTGIFWFDLPLALLLSFLFHNIVKKDLFENLPKNIQSKILGYTKFKWNNYFKKHWIVVLISIFIGIVSHLFWDSFTHDHGYFVNKIQILKSSIIIFDRGIPILKIAQHLSTLIGGLLIIYTLSKLPENNIATHKPNKTYWITLIFLSALIISIRFATGLNYKAYGHVIVSVISSFLLSFILTPFFIKLKTNS